MSYCHYIYNLYVILSFFILVNRFEYGEEAAKKYSVPKKADFGSVCP